MITFIIVVLCIYFLLSPPSGVQRRKRSAR